MRKNKSGAKNVYRGTNGKWYAQVTKDGKVYRSRPLEFEQAKVAAEELRRELKV